MEERRNSDRLKNVKKCNHPCVTSGTALSFTNALCVKQNATMFVPHPQNTSRVQIQRVLLGLGPITSKASSKRQRKRESVCVRESGIGTRIPISNILVLFVRGLN